MTVASTSPERESVQRIRFSRTPHTKTTWESQGQNHNVPFCNLQCPITAGSDESCPNDITCSHTSPHNLSCVHCPSTARDSEHGAQPTFFAMLSLQKEQIRTDMITLHATDDLHIMFLEKKISKHTQHPKSYRIFLLQRQTDKVKPSPHRSTHSRTPCKYQDTKGNRIKH